MIIRNAIAAMQPPPPVPAQAIPQRQPTDLVGGWGKLTRSGQIVSVETAKKIATAYRCANVLSDDIATMPFQTYRNQGNQIERIQPDASVRNVAYLLERQPNRWMTPFIWKKSIINWLTYWGNAYIWQPAGTFRELFVLGANTVTPVMDAEGNLWYQVIFPNGKQETIPDVEMVHLMINSTDGITGRSVLAYARETLGRQLGAHETMDKISGSGLNPTAALWVAGDLSKESREAVRKAYMDAVTGSGNAGNAAIFDNKITKFEPITINPTDAQFLESIAATDVDIANFFGVPLYKLNLGKQSYESNMQQDLDYLKTTLNPFLVQWEQAAWAKWLTAEEQPTDYHKFNRDAILQTDAKTRTEYIEKQIFSGQLTPNEGRQINDLSPYEGGDSHYLPANYSKVGPDGSISTTAAPAGGKTA